MVEIREFKKKEQKKLAPDKAEELLKKLIKEHEKLVKGRFEFVDAKGGWFEFTYRFFKHEPLMTIKLYHDEVCELPMGIVRHLNNTKQKIRLFDTQKELPRKGSPNYTFQFNSRVKFVPLDWEG